MVFEIHFYDEERLPFLTALTGSFLSITYFDLNNVHFTLPGFQGNQVRVLLLYVKVEVGLGGSRPTNAFRASPGNGPLRRLRLRSISPTLLLGEACIRMPVHFSKSGSRFDQPHFVIQQSSPEAGGLRGNQVCTQVLSTL